jgi:hypothetical protein
VRQLYQQTSRKPEAPDLYISSLSELFISSLFLYLCFGVFCVSWTSLAEMAD